MKIYILPVTARLQPKSQSFNYPSHNKDYGVEQDFMIWLAKHPELLTSSQELADWHYLPVFWTRWHINHNFADGGEGLEELEKLVADIILNPAKTFTITQFDGGTLIKNHKIIEFTAARTSNNGFDIPILCSPHKLSIIAIKKRYLAAFNGSFSTHPLRQNMLEELKSNKEVLLGGNVGTPFYRRWILGKQFNLNTLASYTALCPRGTSCNSFRFFEAMQLGVAPILLSDYDSRPFKKHISWNEISYFAKDVDALKSLLQNIDKKEALHKGRLARLYWKQELYYQKWCKYVIKELEEL